MRIDGGGPSGLQSEINVTPLVDVVLVLLIIFMVIAPLTLRGYDVNIPGQAAGAPPDEQAAEQIVLAIDLAGCPVIDAPNSAGLPAGCRVRLNDEQLPVADLARRTTDVFAARAPSDRVLFLAAHDRLNYEAVMRIVDAARSGTRDLRIGLVTEAR